MNRDVKTGAEKAVVLGWRIGGIGMIVLSSLGILFSVLMLLAALLGSAADRTGGVLEAVGFGAASGVFMFITSGCPLFRRKSPSNELRPSAAAHIKHWAARTTGEAVQP